MATKTTEEVLMEEIIILRTLLLSKMLKDGFTLKGTLPNEIKDLAKKHGLDPEKTINIARNLSDEFLTLVFASKKQSNQS